MEDLEFRELLMVPFPRNINKDPNKYPSLMTTKKEFTVLLLHGSLGSLARMTAVTGTRQWSSLVRVLDAHRVLSDSSIVGRELQPMNGVFTSSYSTGTKRGSFHRCCW
ncbi:hypothetical protein KIL84_004555 [Mauremys mutica]|uniref:Uncharacterized protein n=1 Tax=Mauremys mutica TaxID=74926 RepID=A0A9D3XN99_9SAUR|nr:hypothetical protein KIL84_004555 [Mauremys mutica]